MLTVGEKAPGFTLADSNGESVSLSDYAGQWVIFWWYPEANSSGCSLQAISLEKNLAAIEANDAKVLGISFNTVADNDDFACDKGLGYPLLSDPDQAVGEQYDVVRGADEPYPTKPRRYTYVIDPNGKVAFAEDANQVELAQYGEHILDVVAELKRTA